jgi:large subunit ribosomal protein L15
MNLNDAKSSGLPRKYKFPKGRGHSSGIGKTCGRGRKGQYARQGTSFRPYFEGGQMPMLRRLPKFGFNNKAFASVYEEVNVGDLEKVFNAGETVDEASLRAKGLVNRRCDGVKVLGDGTLTKKLAVKVHLFTKSAAEKIQKAGGTAEALIQKPVPKPRDPVKRAAAEAAAAAKKSGGEKPAGEKKPSAAPPASGKAGAPEGKPPAEKKPPSEPPKKP